MIWEDRTLEGMKASMSGATALIWDYFVPNYLYRYFIKNVNNIIARESGSFTVQVNESFDRWCPYRAILEQKIQI